MKISHLVSASVTVLFSMGLLACSSAPEDNSTGTDDEELRTAKICGGFAGIACPDGYECHLKGNYPDASGTCKKTKKPRVTDYQDCDVDDDCTRVNNVEKCCGDCTFEAVNVDKVDAYQSANWCPSRPAACPLACRLDQRVAKCNVSRGKCEMVEDN
jgi:hypothetical protein